MDNFEIIITICILLSGMLLMVVLSQGPDLQYEEYTLNEDVIKVYDSDNYWYSDYWVWDFGEAHNRSNVSQESK